MSNLNFDIHIFKNKYVKEALHTIEGATVKRRFLGIKRWDRVLEMYPYSGVVVLPVRLNGFLIENPFYWVVEKVYEHERLAIKPVEGDPYSVGDVFGFFGTYDFDEFVPGNPIMVVEGVADWGAVKPMIRWVLSSNKAALGLRQLYYLSNLTKTIILGTDLDKAGNIGAHKAIQYAEKIGVQVHHVQPPDGDWGGLMESEFGEVLLERKLNKIKDLYF